jgi:hypothetical protein
MKTKIKYTDEPIDDIKIIRDFLPSPKELAFREQYQRMIRQLLDTYAETQSEPLTKSSSRRAKARG